MVGYVIVAVVVFWLRHFIIAGTFMFLFLFYDIFVSLAPKWLVETVYTIGTWFHLDLEREDIVTRIKRKVKS